MGTDGEPQLARKALERYERESGLLDPGQMPDVGYVIEDRRRHLAKVVMAPIGLRQVFWTAGADGLLIASQPAGLSTPLSDQSLDPDVIFQYLYFHCLPGPVSALPGVAKLGGGHYLDWDGQQATVHRYWKPRFAQSTSLSQLDASSRLKELLGNAVGQALAKSPQCGAFLSGGLDSSTIAGLAATARPGITTVSMGFDADGYDEMEYARIAARHFRTRPLEYYVTPDDVLHSLPRIAAAFAEPFGNSSAAAAFHCARIAREQGLDTLLAGDGGDELFGGNDRYATQLVFERYARVPAFARRLIEPSVRFAANITRRFPVGKAQSYIRQANVPLPDRLQTYNFLHQISPAEIFPAEVLRHVSQSEPLLRLREEYSAPAEADVVARMLFLDWKFTLHDNDLVKVNTVCDLAGVKVAYPMLDPAVVEFSQQIPSSWKIRGGELRWFYKQALRDFLPREILDKTKHGFGLPFGTWTRTHQGLLALAEDCLHSLAGRGYFRPEFLMEAQRLHREGHAAYYGELIWVLMSLELWLQHHMPRAGL